MLAAFPVKATYTISIVKSLAPSFFCDFILFVHVVYQILDLYFSVSLTSNT